ncbi:hypothetical protein RJ55_02275 [Drechmeria coniospora]|nr:hypothetical protein RJ55_02275 [Drechmeria coniospora]
MSSGAEPSLAHKSVAGIRTAPTQDQSPATPHAPFRVTSSSYGSPSTLRAEDDFVLVEIGSRFVRVGFAGDSLPKATLSSGPEQGRRVGDFRAWQQNGSQSSVAESESESESGAWALEHEIWSFDLRQVDLGLFHDRLERTLREAFTRYLLIDSRPRKMGLVLDPSVPIPLLSAVLDTLFNNFHVPVVSLMSSPTMSAVAAGVRSALVIDMGWAETVVTSVYEYKEVKTTRSVRGGRVLHDALYKLLRGLLVGDEAPDKEAQSHAKRVVSFEECEDILCRLMWCRSSAFKPSQRQSSQLDTVREQDESESESESPHAGEVTAVPLQSTTPATTLPVPFDKLADVCDDSYFVPSASLCTFDDHELPLHHLVYHHLLHLPVDVRAVCMSRILFTGGSSGILGIRERLMDELTSMVERRGWVPVSGKGVEQLRANQKLRRADAHRSSVSPVAPSEGSNEDLELAPSETSATESLEDLIEAKIARNRPSSQSLHGQLRCIHSLGPWAGASLLCQLKIPAMAMIDRETWLQQGANGAVRPTEVDTKAQQRQSMGPGGLMRGVGGHHPSWTLGVWGAL